ncbi:MAG: GSCFA domain-containing protein [Pseudoflavonifractor sp.]|nr:GSCFA domain-containing protein [Alloprevotella sp.]MCM1117148.1 GSCFA domain-containing protein [Pseudoflavonifractor sp.]
MSLKLRTEICVKPHEGLLDYERPILLLGSCFSDNIGRRLEERGFKVAYNPLGPVYNALALERQARLIASGRMIDPGELFEHQGLWRHFLAHTLLARPDRHEAAAALNAALAKARSHIGPDTLLCLTLGSAFIYELADGGEAVANCHKLPAARFGRRLAGVEENVSALQRAIDILAPAHTIMTVSPIRHLADGLDGNFLSKATLRMAINRLEKESKEESEGLTYFPAYEALTDDLRDYRFYTPDMTHPTDQAADYIYTLFEEAYASDATRRKAAIAFKAARRMAHRPLLTFHTT